MFSWSVLHFLGAMGIVRTFRIVTFPMEKVPSMESMGSRIVGETHPSVPSPTQIHLKSQMISSFLGIVDPRNVEMEGGVCVQMDPMDPS